jgi:hypothetical protein
MAPLLAANASCALITLFRVFEKGGGVVAIGISLAVVAMLATYPFLHMAEPWAWIIPVAVLVTSIAYEVGALAVLLRVLLRRP